MSQNTDRSEIDATLRERGFQIASGDCPTYIGAINVHGRKVDVKLEIPDTRFVEYPRVHLIDRSQIELAVLAHIEVETGICYASAAGLPLDGFQPGASILRVLREAELTLERSFRGQGVAQVADEYQQYWKGLSVRSLIPRQSGQAAQSATIQFAKNCEKAAFFLFEGNEIRNWTFDNSPKAAQIYRTEGRIGPNGDATPPTNFLALRAWWNAQTSLSEIQWKNVESALLAGKPCFVFSANACVGFEIVRPSDISAGVKSGKIRAQAIPKLLSAKGATLEIRRWSVSDCSLTRITTRNAFQSVSLAGQKVALVGCGTIGSHLARMLVQSGGGYQAPLYLFDTDNLSAGNLGRHMLNFDQLGEGKAIALAREIERFHPDVEVVPLCDNAIKCWPLLAKCDVVVDATGDWNVQNALNELFLTNQRERPAALAHSWVFGNGTAAQSFMNLGDDKACFRCLKPDFSGPWRFPPAQNGIDTEFTPATCGDGTYAAFSVDAPVTAAALTSRAILDWASGSAGSRLRTAVVDQINGRHQPPKTPEPAKSCPACSHLRA
jgi:molybdopterin/thiamine biosynthesis adenylyltransferase